MIIVNGTKKKRVDKAPYYFNAFNKLLSENSPTNEDRDFLKKYAFLTLKIGCDLKTQGTTQEEAQNIASFIFATTDLIAMLTPNEFMQVFPIRKSYDGARYESKDYFSTIKAVSEYPLSEPIGADKIDHFLWDYDNVDIRKFAVNEMMAMSQLRRCLGQKGIAEEFLEKQGLPTYSLSGQDGVLVNNLTGEEIKVQKPKRRIPKQIQIVK